MLFRRAGFGVTGATLEQLVGTGYEAAVEGLISGLTSPDDAGDSITLPSFTEYRRPGATADPQERRAIAAAEHSQLTALQDWWVERMILTSTPLREKLVLFWHGHFATGVSKVRDPRLMYLQNELFRQLGAGDFQVLTEAVAKDGAMMAWLDTNTDKKAHPNENFARELMELFTIGVGNYSQADVTAAARSFTGWTYDRADYRYQFRPAQHDDTSKTFLGKTGDFNGEDVISMLVDSQVSARFVVSKLWSHFAFPVTPQDPVVGDLLGAYGSGLNVSATLRALFLHPAFRSDRTRYGLVKQPVEWVVGAARALGLSATSGTEPTTGGQGRGLAAIAAALGQQLFNPPNVGGWGQNGYWLDTATAQIRLRSSLLLARGADLSAFGPLSSPARVDAAAAALGVDGWGQTSQAALDRVAEDPVELMALALVSPECVLA